ncbi:phenolic glucoside malonyltransferase 2-like [Dioscorea cayenensis subsp. rotundata]|uniref:Phenolic glucoside malonyltransferase 2-like n=1 Tax=Dioscorea cayennensis subsp. rotundata TaxID=55577 RepID=A0AB40CC48_DIOCR|nr:phenolic glucoside malonyltransferase 2-like [Dioscorea cayenensis subsp. rotundata]
MATSNELRVLNQISVYPSPGCATETTLPLTFFDVMWIHGHPVERIFFYSLPQHYSTTDHFINSIVPSLTSSLSLTLHHFYPLAGKLIRHSPNSNDFAIHCKHGDSVSFTVAESLADFQALSSNHPLPFNEVYTLVPILDKFSDDSKPLLSLQVTFFPNAGISIGIAFHHIAGDGSVFGHFLKSWALSCSSLGSVPLLQPPPVFDKSLVKDPHGCYSLFLQQLFSCPSDQGPGSSKLAVLDDAVCSTFCLGLDQIQALKKNFSTKSKDNKTPSTFTVACAYIWVCYVKAQRYPTKERAHFIFPVDCRGRLKPPLPATFFGNCIRPGLAEEDTEKLIGEDGVLVASEAIMRTIDAFKDDAINDVKEWMEKSIAWVGTGRMLSLAGSPKLGIYESDFGWGRPTRVVITSIQKTGAMSLSERRDEDGVEIGFVLPKDIMDEFSSIFSSDLQLLSASD